MITYDLFRNEQMANFICFELNVERTIKTTYGTYICLRCLSGKYCPGCL